MAATNPVDRRWPMWNRITCYNRGLLPAENKVAWDKRMAEGAWGKQEEEEEDYFAFSRLAVLGT